MLFNQNELIGNNIRILRWAAGLDRVNFAARFNISIDDLKLIEHGVKPAGDIFLIDICEEFGWKLKNIKEKQLHDDGSENPDKEYLFQMKDWENLMGATIAKYTDKIELLNQTLFIYSCILPLRKELLIQKEKIMERINMSFGQQVVKDLIVK